MTSTSIGINFPVDALNTKTSLSLRPALFTSAKSTNGGVSPVKPVCVDKLGEKIGLPLLELLV